MADIYVPKYSMHGVEGFLTPSLDFIETKGMRVLSTLDSDRAPILVDGKQGYIDHALKLVIKPIYDTAYPFDNGYAEVSLGGACGIIDVTGREVIPLQYDAAFVWDSPQGRLFGTVQKRILSVQDKALTCLFSSAVDSEWEVYCPNDGAYALLILKKEGAYRLVNLQGEEVLCLPTSIREVVGYFCGGLLFAQNEAGLWGALDLKGETVLDFCYEDVGRFPLDCDGWCVQRNGKWGLVNVAGKTEIDFLYDTLMPAEDGLLFACQEERWGLLSRSGRVVFPFVKTSFGHAPYPDGPFIRLDLPELKQTQFFSYANLTEPYKILPNDF